MDEPTDPTRRRLAMRIAALPAMCATTLPSTHEAIVIKRGEAGHWPIPDDMTIERVNALFGATPAHVAAMLVGSMFGWNMPGADPAATMPTGGPAGPEP